MLCIVNQDKVIEIFYNCDEFCKIFDRFISSKLLVNKSSKTHRTACLSESEIMTILILYHLSGMKCFEYYYREVVLKILKKDFPKAPSYEWFV